MRWVDARNIDNHPHPFTSGACGVATWGFDNKKNLYIDQFLFLPNYVISNLSQYGNQTWEIVKLYSKDFWFKAEFQGNIYFFKYKEM